MPNRQHPGPTRLRHRAVKGLQPFAAAELLCQNSRQRWMPPQKPQTISAKPCGTP